MYRRIETRLALFSVGLIILIVSLIAIGIWFALNASLSREANANLAQRIADTRASLTTATTSSTSGGDDEHHDSEHDTEESHLILTSGDTLIFVADANGQIIANPRNVSIDHIPDQTSLASALGGETDTRVITVGGEDIRVRSEPIRTGDHITGAIQAARSESEHRAQLDLVRNISLLGVAVGAIIAIPTGFLMARRAMTPIRIGTERQHRFVSDASHELRTPLAILRANTEAMLRAPDASAAERDADLQSMLGEMDSMSGLINRLLTLSRLDEGTLTLAREPVDLDDLFAVISRRFAGRAAAAGAALRVDAHGLSVNSDREALLQAVAILVDNALVHATGRDIALRARREGGKTILTVQDGGPGIPPEALPHIFERFYRADFARQRQGGTGLGLAIAHELVVRLGGTITAANLPDGGTEFSISLPSH